MSPIVILVFAPVVVLGLVFAAALLGAATAGAWETVEGRSPRVPSEVRPPVHTVENAYGRAA